MDKSLAKQRALRDTERAMETADIWEAILALGEAVSGTSSPTAPGVMMMGLMATEGTPPPPLYVRKAQGYLLRAGVIGSGDLTDDALLDVATILGSRMWEPNMGPVYQSETVYLPDGTFYICTQPHVAQAGQEPGAEESRRLFRALRTEPDEGEEPLDFMWGERVPFGATRRDPEDGKYYTPAYEQGVTLHEPLYPHLVPGQYTEVEPPVAKGVLRWADLPDGHSFTVGDRFTDYTKTYVGIRAFVKEAQTRPPALSGDAYEQV